MPAGPLLIVANEFLDALPVRQFVDGKERRVMVAGGGLSFDRDGEIVETSPARAEAVTALAKRLAAHGGAAVIIDYGHEGRRPATRCRRFAATASRPSSPTRASRI